MIDWPWTVTLLYFAVNSSLAKGPTVALCYYKDQLKQTLKKSQYQPENLEEIAIKCPLRCQTTLFLFEKILYSQCKNRTCSKDRRLTKSNKGLVLSVRLICVNECSMQGSVLIALKVIWYEVSNFWDILLRNKNYLGWYMCCIVIVIRILSTCYWG